MAISKSFWFSNKGLTLLTVVGGAGYFLWTAHGQHLEAWLPYLFLAICPLMHLFMHRGHGAHDGQGEHTHEGQSGGCCSPAQKAEQGNSSLKGDDVRLEAPKAHPHPSEKTPR